MAALAGEASRGRCARARLAGEDPEASPRRRGLDGEISRVTPAPKRAGGRRRPVSGRGEGPTRGRRGR